MASVQYSELPDDSDSDREPRSLLSLSGERFQLGYATKSAATYSVDVAHDTPPLYPSLPQATYATPTHPCHLNSILGRVSPNLPVCLPGTD